MSRSMSADRSEDTCKTKDLLFGEPRSNRIYYSVGKQRSTMAGNVCLSEYALDACECVMVFGGTV